MAHRNTALRNRSHHARTHHRRHDPDTPNPERSVIRAEHIERIQRIHEHMLRTHDADCDSCGRPIRRGETVFILDTGNAPGFLVCWQCGEVLRMFTGITTPADYPSTPPYGGGITPRGSLMRNSRGKPPP